MKILSWLTIGLASLALITVSMWPSSATSPLMSGQSTRVAVAEKNILINDHPMILVGFRLGSAPLRDDWSDAVISQMDLWKSKGINSMILWLQGSSGGFARVVTPDGNAIGTGQEQILTSTGYGFKGSPLTPNGQTSGIQVITRALKLVEEADKRGMAVIVGFIYRRALNPEDDRATVVRMVKTMARPFRDRTNVIFNIWNEANAKSPRETVSDLTEYVRAAKSVAPGRPVASGTGSAEANLELAGLADVDLICHDIGGNADAALKALQETKAGNKPVINVESFGGKGAGYFDDPQSEPPTPRPYSTVFTKLGSWRRWYGVWPDEDYKDGRGETLAGRQSYLRLIRGVMTDPDTQLHLMVHVAGWFQGGSRVESAEHLGDWTKPDKFNNVFHRGLGKADGTKGNPGIGWILDEIERLR
jgi:hypothetical protein